MTATLNNTQLKAMRTALRKLLPDLGEVLRATRTPDGQGGWVETWGTLSTRNPCRVDAARQIETEIGAGVQNYANWIITAYDTATVAEGDRWQVGGVQYAVTGIDAGKSWACTLRIEAEKVIDD